MALKKRGRKIKEGTNKRQPVLRVGVTCAMCTRFPCFKGIETISSNLAETCHSFNAKKKK